METTSEMTDHQIISLFPLGVVLLPHMEMPLHIFEERYKVMINECLEQKRKFGVVNYDGTNIENGDPKNENEPENQQNYWRKRGRQSIALKKIFFFPYCISLSYKYNAQ